jgi:AraC family transcriptional regulator
MNNACNDNEQAQGTQNIISLKISRLRKWHESRHQKLMERCKKGEYSGYVATAYEGRGLLSSITIYDRQHFNSTLHYHENTHVSLVIHGGCREKKKVDYERLPGMLTFYHAGEPHQIMQVGSYSRHINLEIEQNFLKRYQLDDDRVEEALKNNPDGKFVLLKMQHELLTRDAATEVSIRMLLLDFIHSAEQRKRPVPNWINRIRELVEDNWNEQLGLESLSAAAGVHPVTVCKYFHRHFGCTLGQYLRKLKVERALALISHGDRSLSEIAHYCGFADQSHFIRSCKQLTGFLPGKLQHLSLG